MSIASCSRLYLERLPVFSNGLQFYRNIESLLDLESPQSNVMPPPSASPFNKRKYDVHPLPAGKGPKITNPSQASHLTRWYTLAHSDLHGVIQIILARIMLKRD
jgi:hypothetical protein